MDDNRRVENLEDRLDRIEQKVSELEQAIFGAGTVQKEEREYSEIPESDPKVTFEESYPDSESPSRSLIPENYSFSENWLNWIGIGLLLLGVVFLFKYSIDQGWLIPPVRSAFGLAVGLGLLTAGFRMDEAKSTFRQILLGGSIASFYITGFATFQLYNFTTYATVWIFMILVTLLALSLSLQQDEPVLSVLGMIGGLGTPFMLYRGEGSLTMLMLYTCLVLAGSGTIYLYKGWKPLLWSTVIGGWLVLLVGWINQVSDAFQPSLADQWALQLGSFFSAAVFWAVPVVREIFTKRDHVKWPDPRYDEQDRANDVDSFIAHAHVQLLSVVTPIALLFFSIGIWSISDELWGAIALAAALVLGYTYLPLQKEGLKKLSLVHGFTALILITISLFLLLDGEILMIALALEAMVLRIIAFRTGDRNISISSHILFGFVGIWLVDRFMVLQAGEPAIFNLDALTELFIIGLAGLAVPNYLKHKNTCLIYRLCAHVGVLAWFMKELVMLEDGQALVTTAWGLYALVILYIGFRNDLIRLRFIGMATIFLVVGKLIFVDLAQIQTLLRILLFIGFGALFLAAGYYLQSRWGNLVSETDQEPPDVKRET